MKIDRFAAALGLLSEKSELVLNSAYTGKGDEAKDNLSENCDEAAVDKSDISPFMAAALNPFTFL